MAGIFAGLFLLSFFFGGAPNTVHCPSLMATSTPIYAPDNYIKHADGSRTPLTGVSVWKAGEYLYFDKKVVEYKPIPQAVEYNKRVEACRTANGQF